MKEWILSNAVALFMALVILFGGAYAYGQLNAHVQNLEKIEAKTEASLGEVSNKLNEVAEEVAYIKGKIESE